MWTLELKVTILAGLLMLGTWGYVAVIHDTIPLTDAHYSDSESLTDADRKWNKEFLARSCEEIHLETPLWLGCMYDDVKNDRNGNWS